MAWAQAVHEAMQALPGEGRFRPILQARRMATSVPANIAEASGRQSAMDAYGSLMEAVCECRLARDLGYLSPSAHDRLCRTAEEVARMLSGSRAHLARQSREMRDQSREKRVRESVHSEYGLSTDPTLLPPDSPLTPPLTLDS